MSVPRPSAEVTCLSRALTPRGRQKAWGRRVGHEVSCAGLSWNGRARRARSGVGSRAVGGRVVAPEWDQFLQLGLAPVTFWSLRGNDAGGCGPGLLVWPSCEKAEHTSPLPLWGSQERSARRSGGVTCCGVRAYYGGLKAVVQQAAFAAGRLRAFDLPRAKAVAPPQGEQAVFSMCCPWTSREPYE